MDNIAFNSGELRNINCITASPNNKYLLDSVITECERIVSNLRIHRENGIETEGGEGEGAKFRKRRNRILLCPKLAHELHPARYDRAKCNA